VLWCRRILRPGGVLRFARNQRGVRGIVRSPRRRRFVRFGLPGVGLRGVADDRREAERQDQGEHHARCVPVDERRRLTRLRAPRHGDAPFAWTRRLESASASHERGRAPPRPRGAGAAPRAMDAATKKRAKTFPARVIFVSLDERVDSSPERADATTADVRPTVFHSRARGPAGTHDEAPGNPRALPATHRG
jgi:hypothetical protein